MGMVNEKHSLHTWYGVHQKKTYFAYVPCHRIHLECIPGQHIHTHTRYADVNDICFCIATHTCGNGFHSFCFWPVQLFRLCQSCNHWIYRKSSHNNNNLVEQSSWTTILHISSKYKMIERKDTRWVWDLKEKWNSHSLKESFLSHLCENEWGARKDTRTQTLWRCLPSVGPYNSHR